MISNFLDMYEKWPKIALFDQKMSVGGVPPPPTPPKTIPSNFSCPHCLFTMTLLQCSDSV